MKDLGLEMFKMQCEIGYLQKRVEDFENGSVYTELIKQIGSLKAELDLYRRDSIKLDAIRGVLDV